MKPLSAMRERFCQEYSREANATQAAIKAGYSEKSAYSQGQRLLKFPEVAARITELQAEIAEEIKLDRVAIAQRWAELALAAPNELPSIITSACRWCHGDDHQYQWKTEREFMKAVEVFLETDPDKRVGEEPPSDAGGYGYSWKLQPHEDCPECQGLGTQRVAFRDTTKLSPGAAALFAGVKETQYGLEIKMHDQMKALESLAKHLGMFPNKHEHSGPGGGPIRTINETMTPQEAADAYADTLDSDEG
jgi:phage terminase small subunit